jgi:nuclear pore complex protein Nup98-Nup96
MRRMTTGPSRWESRTSPRDVVLTTQRASFGEQVESPRIQVQPRKYARVALDKSTVNGNEGSRVDAGLAMGRSFRCSWGPNGELVHFGKICKPASAL